MLPSEIPELLWHTISADVLHHRGKDYQVVVDHYSFYWEISLLKDLTSQTVIRALWETFQRHGYPQVFRSDNATQYTNYDLQQLFKKHDIRHVTSSPYYPRSNGIAERAVQEAKKILDKTPYGTPEFYDALLEIRVTPRNETLGSPSQRMVSSQPRTTVQTLSKNLRPPIIKPETVKRELERERDDQKRYYDKGTRIQAPLNKNDGVHILNPANKKWHRGIVVELHTAPRSYTVEDFVSGTMARRTASQLRREIHP